MAMIKPATFLLCLLATCLFFAESATSILPQALSSHNPQIATTDQNGGACSYTVVIKTSCSSPKYTRDRISLSFGDDYGNQVYAPSVDDPATKTFERCSTDTFEILGPCARRICYLYVYRSGYDGWKPETVKVYGQTTKAVTFYFNTLIPNGIWYGFDLCSSNAAI